MRYQADDTANGKGLFGTGIGYIDGSKLTLEDFFSRMSDGLITVVYIPGYKRKAGHTLLTDCEPGRITSVGDRFVFVQFWDQRAARYKEQSQACDPNDLWFRI